MRPRVPVLLLAMWIGLSSGCATLELAQCTPADSTYSCCLKRHADRPWICSGEELALERPVARALPSTGGGATASKIKVTLAAAVMAAAVLDSDDVDALQKLQERLDGVMKECADRADRLMNEKWHQGKRPTPQECRVVMAVDKNGRTVTWAMVLGQEKHREAQNCVEEKLREWMEERYALEQRYRYLGQPGHVEPLSAQQVQRLLQQGRAKELLGTLQPDVVIHSGNLARALWIYEFKFPCVNPDRMPDWNRYPSNHPYANSTQGEMYRRAFNVSATRVAPGQEVLR